MCFRWPDSFYSDPGLEFDRYRYLYRYRYQYQVPIPGISIGMKKIGMNPVSVSVWYGEYLGYRYRLGHIGIGNPVSYRFFNVISV